MFTDAAALDPFQKQPQMKRDEFILNL